MKGGKEEKELGTKFYESKTNSNKVVSILPGKATKGTGRGYSTMKTSKINS